MRQDLVNYVDKDRFAKHSGIELIKCDTGYALTQMEISDKHLNGADMVHGGAIFALADVAFAVASNSKGFLTVAINVSISYFKAPQGKILTAEATEVTSRRTICGYNVDVFDENKELVARFSGTGYIKR